MADLGQRGCLCGQVTRVEGQISPIHDTPSVATLTHKHAHSHVHAYTYVRLIFSALVAAADLGEFNLGCTNFSLQGQGWRWRLCVGVCESGTDGQGKRENDKKKIVIVLTRLQERLQKKAAATPGLCMHAYKKNMYISPEMLVINTHSFSSICAGCNILITLISIQNAHVLTGHTASILSLIFSLLGQEFLVSVSE